MHGKHLGIYQPGQLQPAQVNHGWKMVHRCENCKCSQDMIQKFWLGKRNVMELWTVYAIYYSYQLYCLGLNGVVVDYLCVFSTYIVCFVCVLIGTVFIYYLLIICKFQGFGFWVVSGTPLITLEFIYVCLFSLFFPDQRSDVTIFRYGINSD